MTKYLIATILFFTLFSFQISNEKKKAIEIKEIDPIDLPYKFSKDIQTEIDSSDEPWRFQLAGSKYSYIGNEEKTFENFYGNSNVQTPLSDSAFTIFQKNYHAKNAIDYILERAQKEQIVIINEAHHIPKHRAITQQLLQELYKQGFRYLGLETLSGGAIRDSSLSKRGYPIISTGVYTIEPQFGNMLRKALEIGFELFPYEGEGNGKPREIAQAKNIQAFMEKHPNEKILIHCGYDHAKEGDIKSSWEKAMAGRLLEFTGVNPLTINQTAYHSRLKKEYTRPLQQRLNLHEPTVFIDSTNLSYEGERNDSAFDIMVFHDQAKYENERPLWLLLNGKTWQNIELGSIKLSLPYFVLAYKNGEDIRQAIPMDLVEVREKKEKITLALETGKYTIVVQNSENKAVSFEMVTL